MAGEGLIRTRVTKVSDDEMGLGLSADAVNKDGIVLRTSKKLLCIVIRI